MTDLLQRPDVYLIRLGSTIPDYPALSDPPLSEDGIKQAHDVAEFFSYEGFSDIQVQPSMAAVQFADILKNSGCTIAPNFPKVFILNGNNANVSMVHPGGVIAVYVVDGKNEFVPRLNAVELKDMN
jgi:hypothetical protein